MSEELVKRLRFPLSQLDGGPNDEELWDRIYTDREEAADRIEALEAALLEIFDHECRTSDKSFIACTARDALWHRAALAGEKKDG